MSCVMDNSYLTLNFEKKQKELIDYQKSLAKAYSEPRGFEQSNREKFAEQMLNL